MAESDFIKSYTEALVELRTPDKSHINTLTMLAEDNRNYAKSIVDAVQKHLENVCCGIGRCRGRVGSLLASAAGRQKRVLHSFLWTAASALYAQ